MADLYVATELLKATDLDITTELNGMAERGWRLAQMCQYVLDGAVHTTLVFQRELPMQIKKPTFAEEMALEWAVDAVTDDSVLLDEMRAAEQVKKVPAADPLIKGLTR